MNPLAPVPSLSSHPYPLQQSWSRQLERHITNASAAIAPWRTKRENFWWFKPTYSENFWCLIEENFISMWKLLSIDFVWRWRLMVYYLKRFTCFNINHKISEIIHTFECLPLRGVPMRTFSHGRHQTTFFIGWFERPKVIFAQRHRQVADAAEVFSICCTDSWEYHDLAGVKKKVPGVDGFIASINYEKSELHTYRRWKVPLVVQNDKIAVFPKFFQ